MHDLLFAPLLATLRPHFGLGKACLQTLAVLIVGLANCRTVNLSHLASQFPGSALHASNYRRLQRFFQHARLDGDVIARLTMRLLKLERPVLLALDRTNWKLGSRDVNTLVLAVVTRRFEKRAKVGDGLRGGISWRCSDAVNSLPRKGYATCQRLPSPRCLIHPDFPRTL